jgi:hypothetical protein
MGADMTPEKREKLTSDLAPHGLSVLLTRDFDGILLQLARLAQFERLMMLTAAGNPSVECAVEHVHCQQISPVPSPREFSEPLETIHIPQLLQAVNVELQRAMDNGGNLMPDRVAAAVLAFSAILIRS